MHIGKRAKAALVHITFLDLKLYLPFKYKNSKAPFSWSALIKTYYHKYSAEKSALSEVWFFKKTSQFLTFNYHSRHTIVPIQPRQCIWRSKLPMQSLLIVEPRAPFLTILRFQCCTEDLKCWSKLQATRFFFSNSLTQQDAFKGMFHSKLCCRCFHSWLTTPRKKKRAMILPKCMCMVWL